MSGRRQPAIPVGQGCVLRAWEVQDAPELLIGVSDPLIRHYGARLIDTREQALAAIQGWSRRWADGVGAAWALRSSAGGGNDRGGGGGRGSGGGRDRGGGSGGGGRGELLGAVQYAIIDEEFAHGSVGYWLMPHARGRGLASAALIRSCPMMFDRLGWYRIELSHAVENERSCAVARRAGFAAEGVLRSAMVYPVDERRSDEHLHARLRTDPPVQE